MDTEELLQVLRERLELTAETESQYMNAEDGSRKVTVIKLWMGCELITEVTLP